MRILILGAGATGGYYGVRLAEAGADVTFLVREKRADALSIAPLAIESPRGNVAAKVTTVTAATVTPGYDAVLLSCKSYDLESAIAALRPAMQPGTLVLPLLNGMGHLETLDQAFGADNVLGGSCQISVTLRSDGVIEHMIPLDALTFGPRLPSQQAACEALLRQLQRGGFEVRMVSGIVDAMWDKWAVIATLAAMTTLLRADTGEISATAKGAGHIAATLAECCAIAAAQGHEIPKERVAEIRTLLTDPETHISASMRRDLEAGSRIEADHIIGDLIARGRSKGVATPLLDVAYTALEAYHNRSTAGTGPKK